MFFYLCVLCCFAPVIMVTDTLYVFAYSWTPEFCYGQSYPGCKSPQYFWGKYLTIHGLWPQYTTTGYPSYCTTEPFNTTAVETTIGIDTLITFWPNVQYADTADPTYTHFWEHEWSKHGTCSGLSQTTYFASAIDLLVYYSTPPLIFNHVGETVSTADLRNAMGGANSVALQCGGGGNYLSGAYRCFGRDFTTGQPTTPVTCPEEVLKEDTCTHDNATIQPM